MVVLTLSNASGIASSTAMEDEVLRNIKCDHRETNKTNVPSLQQTAQSLLVALGVRVFVSDLIEIIYFLVMYIIIHVVSLRGYYHILHAHPVEYSSSSRLNVKRLQLLPKLTNR